MRKDLTVLGPKQAIIVAARNYGRLPTLGEIASWHREYFDVLNFTEESDWVFVDNGGSSLKIGTRLIGVSTRAKGQQGAERNVCRTHPNLVWRRGAATIQ